MPNPIRQAVERLQEYAAAHPEHDTAELVAAALATLAAEPPAPDPCETLAARPLLEAVARLGDCIGQHTVGEIATISDRAAAWLRENPPGQPVAIEPRGCPTPGACSCVEFPAPVEPDTDAVLTLAAIIREVDGNNNLGAAALAEAILSHHRVANVFQPPAPDPAANGEVEELAQWLDNKGRGAWPCPDGFSAKAEAEEYEMFSGLTRAAALLREARPQPVPVAERPWERPGWCDAKGRCWFGAPIAGAADAGWILRKPSERLSHQTVSLPHWAIPQPLQGGEVES